MNACVSAKINVFIQPFAVVEWRGEGVRLRVCMCMCLRKGGIGQGTTDWMGILLDRSVYKIEPTYFTNCVN